MELYQLLTIILAVFLAASAAVVLLLARRLSRTDAEKRELEIEAVGLRESAKWLGEADKHLQQAFENLAGRALRANSQELMQRSLEQLTQFKSVLTSDWGTQKQELTNLVQPLNRELEKMDRQVRALEQKRENAYGTLETQIKQMSTQYRVLQQSTDTLNQALRSTTVRGKWGEVQLRRLAEMAGMSAHVDFDEQTATKDGGRPDMVIHLPSSGTVPVDAKAPMDAYLSAQETDNPTLREEHLRAHAAALKKHISALSQKAYWSQFDPAPEFVVLLVPYESGLSAAFENDPALLENALQNKVIVTGPASFLALLKVVAYGWMQLELSNNAREITNAGRELLDRLRVFASHFDKLGAAVGTVVDRYNQTAGSMVSRVLPGARKLRDLGAGGDETPDPPIVEGRPRQIQFDGDE